MEGNPVTAEDASAGVGSVKPSCGQAAEGWRLAESKVVEEF